MHGDKTHSNEEPLTYDEVLIIKVQKSNMYGMICTQSSIN